MLGVGGWEERKVDRPRRLVLRCLVFHNKIVMGSGGVMAVQGGDGGGVRTRL